MLPPGAVAASRSEAAPSVDSLLPPGAQSSSSPSVDELLPPGTSPGTGTRKSGAAKSGAAKESRRKRETVTFATNDGGHVTLEEPVKKVGNRELVPLSPEEKKIRRLWRNVIVVGVCAILLFGTLWVLLVING
jgi:hypothetical protein